MEGIVAKRTLKKSYYNDKYVNDLELDKLTQNKKQNTKKQNFISNFKSKLLFKISLQTISMISILIFVIGIKYFKVDVVLNADITKKIVTYYNKDYSLNQIKNKTKQVLKNTYKIVKPVIPNKLEQKFKQIIIKKDNNKEVKVYEENSNINKEDKEEIENGVGASVDEETTILTNTSSVSSEENIIQKIKNTKVKFVKPLTGTITSTFGAREVIFKDVNSYHTGTDIATKEGTVVKSSISGKVTVATYNKYNGNYVEITNGKIVTKYCHMNKITTKVGKNVNAGDKIGEVGSTGYSTGPHLHFEIVYNGTKVDPQKVLEL